MQDGRSIQLAPAVCVNDCHCPDNWVPRVWIRFAQECHYRQDCGKCKLPVLNLLTGRKFRSTRCTDSSETWHGRRARGSAWLCKISPQSAKSGGNSAISAQKYEKFPLLVVASQGRILWLISRIFMSFYTPNYHAFVLRSYCWETARRSITAIFPCIL